jgi:DNA-binding NarL/FixJ family response regulator
MAIFIIADNQELTSFGLERLADTTGGGHIYHAPDKTELVELLKVHEESMVLVDYTLFDFTDIDNLLIINQRFSKASWILISEDLTEQLLKRVIYSSRNISIVFKDSPLKEINDAISYALKGDRYICQRVTEILLTQKQKESETFSTLTPTEIEILKAIAQGKTTKDIAAERFSSIHTINTHRKNIFRKLGVNTAHEAIKAGVLAGLIDTAEYYI